MTSGHLGATLGHSSLANSRPQTLLRRLALVAALLALCMLTSHRWPAVRLFATAPPINYTTTGQLVSPSAASGVSVTPSGTAWISSSWVQVTASTSGGWVLTGVSWFAGTTDEAEIDVGTGSSGSEVVIATAVTGYMTFPQENYFPFQIPIDNIASGSRVAVRIRTAGTGTTAWQVTLTYLPKPVSGVITTTAVAPTSAPSAAASIALTTGATAWANGSWVQLTASTSSAWVVNCVTMAANNIGETEIDIGTGASGSEVVVATVRAPMTQNILLSTPNIACLRPLLNNVASGARVALRARAHGGSGTVNVKLNYYPAPSSITQVTTAKAQTYVETRADSTGLSFPGLWSNGSWTQEIASTSSRIAIIGCECMVQGSDVEVDVGTGASGSETVIGTMRFVNGSAPGATGSLGGSHLPLPFGIGIPVSSRVSARARGSSSSPTSMNLALMYVPAPDFNQMVDEASGIIPSTLPAAANAVSVTPSSSAWANSPWGQLTAATGSTGILVTQVNYASAIDGVDLEIDLGTGASGSEVVLTTLRVYYAQSIGNGTIPLVVPERIPASTRVAVRMRHSGTSTTAFLFSLSYLPESGLTASPNIFPSFFMKPAGGGS